MSEMKTLSENEKKLLSALGMATRAGTLIFGVPMICEALGSHRQGAKYPKIVFEACDSSENTHKRISDRCTYYNVRHIRLEIDGGTLASALGKISSLAAVALTDDNFCRLVEKYI